MEKVSVLNSNGLKSPYLSIKFPYKSVELEIHMKTLMQIMAIADATRSKKYIESFFYGLNQTLDKCTSIEDFARVNRGITEAIKKGGLAKEKEIYISHIFNEKEKEIMAKMPEDSKVTCVIPEVDGIYSLYSPYSFVPGHTTKNTELKKATLKYLQQLKFSDNLRTEEMFEKLKSSIRNVIQKCKNEKEFDEVQKMLDDLKSIGGIAVQIYPIASNMNKQAKEHFLNEKAKQEKKDQKEANKQPKKYVEPDRRNVYQKYKDEKYPKTDNFEFNEAIIKLRTLISLQSTKKKKIKLTIIEAIISCEGAFELELLEYYLENLSKHGGMVEELYDELKDSISLKGQASLKQSAEEKDLCESMMKDYIKQRDEIYQEYVMLSTREEISISELEQIIEELDGLKGKLQKMDEHSYISDDMLNQENEKINNIINGINEKIEKIQEYLNSFDDESFDM